MSFRTTIRRPLIAIGLLALAGGTAQAATVYQLDSISLQTSSVGGEYPFGSGPLAASVCSTCGSSLVTDDGAGNLTVGSITYSLIGFGANFTNTFSGTSALGAVSSLIKNAGETCVVNNTATHLCNPADQRSFAGSWYTGLMADGVTEALTHQFSALVNGDDLVLRVRTNRDASPVNDPDWLQLNFKYSVVPVPAAVWLFGGALGLLGFARRRTATA
ncbi:MAG: hypothetical protein R3F24_14490 [Gammaproteobacteria bacterium]